jgi:hypothetical protein
MDASQKPKKPLRFDARVTKSSNKIIIIIPKRYHQFIAKRDFLGKLVHVTITDIEDEELSY